jgi:hypothetical protein
LGAIRGLSAIGDVAIDFVLPVLRQIFLDYSEQTPTQIDNNCHQNTPSQPLEQRNSRPLIEVINSKELLNEKIQRQLTDKNANTNTNRSSNNKKKESDDSLPKRLQVRLEVGEALLQVQLSSTFQKTFLLNLSLILLPIYSCEDFSTTWGSDAKIWYFFHCKLFSAL